MNPGRVVSSVIVRVIEAGRGETRIVVHDLLNRSVKECRSWEAAFEHLQKIARARGLR